MIFKKKRRKINKHVNNQPRLDGGKLIICGDEIDTIITKIIEEQRKQAKLLKGKKNSYILKQMDIELANLQKEHEATKAERCGMAKAIEQIAWNTEIELQKKINYLSMYRRLIQIELETEEKLMENSNTDSLNEDEIFERLVKLKDVIMNQPKIFPGRY